MSHDRKLQDDDESLASDPPRRQWVPWAEFMKILRTGEPDPRFFEDVAELGTVDDLKDPWER